MATREDFSGTALAPEHIGSANTDALLSYINGTASTLFPRADSPKIDKLSASSVSLAALPASLVLTGRDFLSSQSFAVATVGEGTASLAFTARRPGTPGNAITITVVDSAGGGLAATANGNAVEIDLGGSTPSASAVLTALEAVAAIDQLVGVAVSGGGGGAFLAAAATPLAGGLGTGVEVWVNGIAHAITETLTNTSCTVALTATSLAGTANGNACSASIKSDGVTSSNAGFGIVT